MALGEPAAVPRWDRKGRNGCWRGWLWRLTGLNYLCSRRDGFCVGYSIFNVRRRGLWPFVYPTEVGREIRDRPRAGRQLLIESGIPFGCLKLIDHKIALGPKIVKERALRDAEFRLGAPYKRDEGGFSISEPLLEPAGF
jgi:hypothetical protein